MDHLTLSTAIPMNIVESPLNIARVCIWDDPTMVQGIKKQRRQKFAYK